MYNLYIMYMCFCVYNIICIVCVCVCACVYDSVSLYVYLCVRLRFVCVRRARVVCVYIYELWCMRMVCISVNCRWGFLDGVRCAGSWRACRRGFGMLLALPMVCGVSGSAHSGILCGACR